MDVRTALALLAALAFACCPVGDRVSAAPPAHPAVKPQATPTPKPLRVIGSVVSHPRSAKFNNTPAAVKVFPREAYRDQGQATLTSILSQTPGGFPIFPASENIAVRGVPAYASVRESLPFETAVSIDGVPVTMPLSGTFDTAYIPSFMLGDVEIGKGPGNVTDIVPNAVAGSLNFRTAEPTVTRRALLEFSDNDRGGSFDDLWYGGTMPGGKLAVATMISTDGTTIWSNTPLPLYDLRRAQIFKLRFTPNDNLALTGTYLGTQTILASSAPFASRQQADLGFYDLDAQFGHGQDTYDARTYDVELACNGTFADTERITGGRFGWDHQIAQNLYSASFEQRNESAAGLQATDAIFNAAAQLHPQSHLEFDVGTGLDLHDATPSETFPALRAGVSYTPRTDLAFRAAFGTSFAPVPFAAEITTPGLRSETALNYDIGGEWRLPGNTTTLSTDLYRNVAHDTFAAQSAAGQPVTLATTRWWNVPLMVSDGFEASLVQFKRVGLGFIVQGAFVRTQLTAPPAVPLQTLIFPGPSTINIPSAPYAQSYDEISYKWPYGSRASIGMLYLGAHNPYAPNAFATFNSNLELSLGGKAKLQISAENLFNIFGTSVLPGFGIPGEIGEPALTGALMSEPNLLQPRTIRVMFRQSFGAGSVYER